MYNESLQFDSQRDAVSIIGTGVTEMEDGSGMSDTEFAHKVLAYKGQQNKVICLPIGYKTIAGHTVTVYESLEDACKRTYGR